MKRLDELRNIIKILAPMRHQILDLINDDNSGNHIIDFLNILNVGDIERGNNCLTIRDKYSIIELSKFDRRIIGFRLIVHYSKDVYVTHKYFQHRYKMPLKSISLDIESKDLLQLLFDYKNGRIK